MVAFHRALNQLFAKTFPVHSHRKRKRFDKRRAASLERSPFRSRHRFLLNNEDHHDHQSSGSKNMNNSSKNNNNSGGGGVSSSTALAVVSSRQESFHSKQQQKGGNKKDRRLEIDEATLRAIRYQYDYLLCDERAGPPSVYHLSVTLMESADVLQAHHHDYKYGGRNNNNNNLNNGRRRDGDALSRLTSDLNYLHLYAQEEHLLQKEQERTDEFMSKLKQLASSVGSVTKTLSNWEDVKEALSTVFVLPEEEQEQKEEEKVQKEQLQQQRQLRRPVLQSTKSDSAAAIGKDEPSLQRYMDQVRRAQQEAERKWGPSKWKQVALTPIPPRIGVAAVDAYKKQEKDIFDKAVETADQQRLGKQLRAQIEVEELIKEKELKQKQEEASAIASSLLRPLSTDEQAVVQKAIYGGGDPSEALASTGTDWVQRSSMQKLRPGEWINDETIHYFYLMLANRDEKLWAAGNRPRRSHFFKSFFYSKLMDEGNANPNLANHYNYSLVKRWSKKVPGKDLFNLDKVFFPINQNGMHWICAVAFIQDRKIQVFDSLGGPGNMYLENLFQYLKDEHKAKKGSPLPDQDAWELIPTRDETPRQLNGYDCGVFTCMFADFISQDCPLAFTQQHITKCRERIALSIMNGSAIV